MGKAILQRLKSSRIESAEMEAMLNLLIAADAVRLRMEKICESHGITQAQYNVLRILRGVHPKGHPRCEIIERLVEHAPDVTRLVDRMEKNGLVERDRSSEDRRLSLTRITDKGLGLIDEMDSDIRGFHTWFGSRLARPRCLALSRLCEKLYGPDLSE
jgi:DNA-binding MarR family transcriptional regulator